MQDLNDGTFAAFHRLQDQHAQLQAIERQVSGVLEGDIPLLEEALLTELLKKLRARIDQSTDLLITTLPPLTIRITPGVVVDGRFMAAAPLKNFVSMARHGVLSRMKQMLEEGSNLEALPHEYEATVPVERVEETLLFAAEDSTTPYVTLAPTPQRVIRLLKSDDTKFPFHSLAMPDSVTGVI